MSSPLVSVICTVRGHTPFLTEAIEALQSQSLRSWELILVDDNDSVNRINPYVFSTMDDRIMYAHAQELGRGSALNEGIRVANGRYIAINDADDISHPLRLERQVQALCCYETDVIVGSPCFQFEESEELGSWLRTSPPGPNRLFVNDELRKRNPICHSSLIASRELFHHVGGYDDRRKSQFDYDFLHRASRMGALIVRDSWPASAKRIHGGQSFEAQKHLRYRLRSCKLQLDILQETEGSTMDFLYLAARMSVGFLPQAIRTRVRMRRL